MKIKVLLLLIGWLLSITIQAQTTLSFKIDNPRVIYSYNDGTGIDEQNLEFEVLMKAAAANTRYFAISVRLSVNAAAFDLVDGFDYTQGPLGAGSLSARYTVTTNTNSGNLNLFINSNQASNSTTTSRFMEIPTVYAAIGTFRIKITDPTQTAGISFLESNMNGQQSEKLFASPWLRFYASPNLYEGSLSNLYLGRIYNNVSGWSQYGGTTPDVLFLDWSSSVNTSVWEGSPVLSSNVNPYIASALRIHNGSTLTLNPGANLTVGGDLDIVNAEALKILSDATGIGSLITMGNVTGTANIQQYNAGSYYTGNYHLISVPVDQVWSYTTFLHFYLKRFNETTGMFVDVQSNPGPGGTQLLNTPMEGFSSSFSGWNPDTTITFIGVPNTGNKSIGYTYNNQGWNLLGNPYSSSIDWDLVTKPGTMDGAFYVWDAAAKNYKFYNLTGWPSTASKFIPPAQGFFIKANGAGSLGFGNTVRAHGNQFFYKDDPQLSNCLKLETTGNSYSDVAFVMFNPAGTAGYDSQIDVAKLLGFPEVPSIYSYSGNDTYALNVLSTIDETPRVEVAFQTGQGGTYTITASGIESFETGTPLLLEDLVTNQVIDLRQNPVYSFAYSTSDPLHRFNVHFKNTFGIGEISNGSVNIFGGDNEINVMFAKQFSGNIAVTDIMGRTIYSGAVSGLENVIPVTGSSQYYIVKVSGSSKVITEKVFVR